MNPNFADKVQSTQYDPLKINADDINQLKYSVISKIDRDELDAEIAARKAGDIVVTNQTDAKLSSKANQFALNDEATVRQLADNVLQNSINSKASTIDLQNEVTERKDSFAKLSSTFNNTVDKEALTAEANLRVSGDALLQTNINAKVSQTSFNTEVNLRIAGDALLQSNITNISTGVGTAIPSDSPQPNIRTYNVSQAGTYTNFSGVVITTGDTASGLVQLQLNGVSGTTWSKVITPIDLGNYATKAELTSSYAGITNSSVLNLLDYSKLVSGTINGTGGISASSTSLVSDFIPIKASTVYSTWRLLNSSIVRGVGVSNIVSFYTSGKGWISPLYTTGNTSAITSPATGAFMRIAVTTTNIDLLKLMMLIEGDTQPARLYRYGSLLANNVLIEKENIEQAVIDSPIPVLTSLQKTSGGITQKQLSFMTKTVNLFDINTVQSGAMNTTTGANIVDATYVRSDYIEAKPDTNYSLWNTLPLIGRVSTSGTVVFFYNANKTIIIPNVSLVTGAALSPAGTAYMRFHIKRITDLNKGLILIEGDTQPTKFIPFGFALNIDNVIPASSIEIPIIESATPIINTITKQNNWLLPENASFLQTGVNLYDSSKQVLGKSINTTTGNEANSSGFLATGFLPMSYGKNYLFTRNNPPVLLSSFAQGAWYNINKIFVSAATASGGIYTPPSADVVYFRGSIQGTDSSLWQMIEGTITPVRFTPYGYIPNPALFRTENKGKWFDKKWGALGDSFTWQNKYKNAVCDRTGLIQSLNLGVVGALLKTRADALTVENIVDIDIITVMAGTNDYGHGTATFGTVTDDKDANTIQGNVAYVIDKILTLKPTVRVVFITQPTRGLYATEPNWTPPQPNNNGLTMENISRAIVEKCRYMGIPCLDGFANFGLNTYNLSIYTDDNLHPNGTFGAKMGDLIGEFINNLNV